MMKKKYIALAIVGLFVMTNAASATNVLKQNNKAIEEIKLSESFTFSADIYVDDDANTGWYDETHVKTINEGITNASEGNLVFVYNGTYYEMVRVNKLVEIKGEDKQSTIINGENVDNVVHIIIDGVNLSGFTIKGSSRKFRDNNSGIEINSDNNIISDNIITGNVRGILIYGGSNNQIIDNIISKNRGRLFSGGIYLLHAHDNIISGNEVSKHLLLGGIHLHKSNNNTISNNQIIKNKYAGISISESSNINVTKNNIRRNTRGIELLVSEVNNITITKNNFLFNLIQSKFQVKKFLSLKNTWDQNYWNRPRILPYRIFGTKYILPLIEMPNIPLLTFDLHPAKKPYEL